MKAIVFARYGPPEVLQLREIPTPSPGERQVLLRIRAASVNAADWHIMRANAFFAVLTRGRQAEGQYRPSASAARQRR